MDIIVFVDDRQIQNSMYFAAPLDDCHSTKGCPSTHTENPGIEHTFFATSFAIGCLCEDHSA